MNLSHRKIVWFVVICITIMVVLVLFYYTRPLSQRNLIFSETELLNFTWHDYKEKFIEDGTYRTLDPQRNAITTSEGQSYTLLRAVWMDDKEVFDNAFLWTTNNLGREDDQLFSWLFGERPDGSYGVILEAGGETSAIDADSDIATALLFAYARWRDEDYLREARETIDSIWEKAVVEINGIPYLAANDIEKNSDKSYIIVNPSYLAPYSYRMFALADPEHDWLSLVDSSYEVIMSSLALPLDAEESAGLPPDWIVIDKTTGEILPAPETDLSTDYGFEALRLPWRLALDWEWYEEPRARETLRMMRFLSDQWDNRDRLSGSYSHAGDITLAGEVNAMYAGSLGHFIVTHPMGAREIYHEKLLPLYSHDRKTWRDNLSYYDANWVWFGIALYVDQLPNLADYLPELETEEVNENNDL